MINRIKNIAMILVTMTAKVIRDPSLIKRNMTRKVFNRIFTSNLKRDQYDIVRDLKEFPVLEFPKVEKPLVTIIVTAYNKWEFTYACMVTILRNITGVSYEVILADDVSTDETKNAEMYLKNVVVLHNPENLRFVKNNNNAAKHAQGKYIVLLNNDTNVQKNWLESMVKLIESDPKIGVVGAKMVYPDGRLQDSGNLVANNGVPQGYGNLFNPNNHEFNYVKEVDYVTGASVFTKKELWDKLGGFDEDFSPGYFEENDYCFRVREAGYKVMYQPQAVLIHYEGTTHGTNTNSSFKAYQVTNQEKFFKKWQKLLEKEHRPYNQDLFLVRDRSQFKKTMVVIDSRVPLYDQEAGSRSTFNYLQLFVDMGMNVKFIANSLSRYEPYTTTLEQMGIEVIYASQDNANEWIKTNGQYFDYVYIHRPDIAELYLANVQKYSQAKVIYQTHDLHFLREQRRYEVEGNKDSLAKSKKFFTLEKHICQSVDYVLTFSTFEEEVIKKEFGISNVTSIPLYLFKDFAQKEPHKREGMLFIGGFGHFPNRDGVLWFANEIFPKVLEKVPSATLTIGGSNPPEEITKLASSNITVLPNVSDEKLAQLHDESEILIVPLRYGAGVKGKVIDALYHGVPMVSTGVGIEGIPQIESLIKAADTPDEFASQIVALYGNNNKNEKLHSEYVQFAKDNFSFDYAAALFRKILGYNQ